MADLCELDDVKAWLEIPDTNKTADAMLTRLISATSAEFIQAIDRNDFTPEVAFTDSMLVLRTPASRAQKSITVVLKHWPVNTITSVTVDGTAVAESSDGFADGYVFSDGADPEARVGISIVGSLATSCSTSPLEVTVVYDAGYDTVPADVTQAVIDWVAYKYRSRQWIGMTQKHMNAGETVSYEQVEMPTSTACCVERYKRPTGKWAA